jgi:hypothetical protein
LHRRLGQRQLEFLALGPLPALDQAAASAGLAGMPSSTAALPPSMNRLRQRMTDSVDTP